jgi:putative peptidoglycan lipid II flippase
MKNLSRMLLVVGLILLGKFSGFFKDILMTFYHGVSVVTDAYFLSLSISSLLYMALYSAIPIIVVPLYSRFVNKLNRDKQDKVISATLLFFVTMSIALTVIIFFFSISAVRIFSGGVSETVRNTSAHFLAIMALSFVLSTLVSFFNSLQTVDRITIPSYFTSIINNAVFCFGLFLFNTSDKFSQILYFGVIAWFFLAMANGWLCRKSFHLKINEIFNGFKDREFLQLLLPAIGVFYVDQLNSFVAVFFASEAGHGSISILAYSTKLTAVFQSVFLIFLTATLFPRIAVACLDPDRALLKDYLILCIRLMILIAVPITFYMGLYARQIVGLIFERGRFVAEDAVSVGAIFALLVFALPFGMLRDLMNRVFFSFNDTLTPALISLFVLLMNVIFCVIALPIFGMAGIAGAVVAATALNGVLCIYLIQRKTRINLSRDSLNALFAACTAVAAAYAAIRFIDDTPLWNGRWILLSIPFAVVYFLGLGVMRVKEIQSISRILR